MDVRSSLRRDEGRGLAVRKIRLPNLPHSHDLVLRRSEFRQREGSPAVQLLRADPHLGAEAEFCAVGEAG